MHSHNTIAQQEVRLRSRARTKDKIEKEDIEQALWRNWSIDNGDIQVKVSGNNVTLYGIVDSLYQRNEAERIAWNAPGVLNVDNGLIVE